jgi:hypothetical protein
MTGGKELECQAHKSLEISEGTKTNRTRETIRRIRTEMSALCFGREGGTDPGWQHTPSVMRSLRIGSPGSELRAAGLLEHAHTQRARGVAGREGSHRETGSAGKGEATSGADGGQAKAAVIER